MFQTRVTGLENLYCGKVRNDLDLDWTVIFVTTLCILN